jgi:shikimate dehydrogenase
MGVCYLLGYPVGHSMSAVMHNAAFRELSLEHRYELLPVRPGDLASVMSGRMRDPDVLGANVTIPHKVAVLGLLDWVEPEASRIGAVNTVVNDGGVLRGHNTDGMGAMRALLDATGDLGGSRILLLGAGGAARAIGYHLSKNVEALVIANRTVQRAVELAADLSSYGECVASVEACSLTTEDLKAVLKEADILINTTSVGMAPHVDESPICADLLSPGLLVFDAVYNPMRTKLLRDAEEAGARTLGGLRMLVYQGAAAFELWTGLRAPEELMLRHVEEHLGGGGG